MRYAFVFVCQSGELELKAMLLAASLREKLGPDTELIAAVPGPESTWGRLEKNTLALLERLNVRIASIENRMARDYPIGNKFECLRVPTDADVLVFLDSDILCMRPFAALPDEAVCLSIADKKSWSANDADWGPVYEKFGLKVPEERLETRFTRESTPPYFNAGFVAVRCGVPLAERWVECSLAIDEDPAVRGKRPWLDQIALPVAVRRLDEPYACVPLEYNYPAQLMPIRDDQVPVFAHYHEPQVFLRTPVMRREVKHLLAKHPELVIELQARPKHLWRWLLRPDWQIDLLLMRRSASLAATRGLRRLTPTPIRRPLKKLFLRHERPGVQL